jgi:hypothetical protein
LTGSLSEKDDLMMDMEAIAPVETGMPLDVFA